VNFRVVSRLTSLLIGLVAVALVAPLALAIYDAQPRTALAYGWAIVLALFLAYVLKAAGRGASVEVHRKDALGVVAMTWIALGLVGALPFLIEGSITDPAAALFEAVSGFTTTGATVIADVGALSRATNLWRCLMHWIGGMGIVVLFVALFPQLGVGAKLLFRSEVPGPITEGLRPKIKQTAMALWWIYGGLTLLAAGLLLAAGMPLFDAVCHAMSILGTGGYSTKAASIGAYDSALIDWICIVFMIVAGLNFGLYYGLWRGRARDLLRNFELRFYLAINLAVALLVTLSIADTHGSWVDAFRYATFQTVAVTTTTGLMTEDFDTYPNVARFALFACMFMGGCAGSTAGGLKASRVYVILKVVVLELDAVVRPNTVRTVRVGRMSLPSDTVRHILAFFAAYMLIFMSVSFFLVALDLDFVSAMSGTIACLSSVGPGLGDLGPVQNFGVVPTSGKLVLSFCMIAGRLEIFALLAIFARETWRP
jgi:trk system potassium uptake protein